MKLFPSGLWTKREVFVLVSFLVAGLFATQDILVASDIALDPMSISAPKSQCSDEIIGADFNSAQNYSNGFYHSCPVN